MTIGNNPASEYGAELISYEIGACEITNGFFAPPSSMRPIALKGRYGTRPIRILMEFMGESENAVATNIANVTLALQQGAELTFTDGFTYYAVLEKQGTPTRHAPTIYTVAFDLVGVRHGPMKTVTISSSGSKTIIGQVEAPAKFTITDGSGAFSINGISLTGITGTVVIDGFEKTVKQAGVNFFSNCTMTKFPTVTPGSMTFTRSGTGTLKLEYQPVYL